MAIIPFLDLQTQYFSIKDEIDKAVLEVLASSKFALGPAVEKFEKEFAEFQGVEYAVAVNSGTSALHASLRAAGVKEGCEVITVSMTFIATVAAISYVGAKPVFVDIEETSFNMDPSKIEEKITPKTKAIIPVHLHGQSANMDPIMEIAERYNITVIEDAAQAHGAEYNGKRVGGIGHMASFSFYPGKNLGAYGEGGVVTTNNADHANYVRLLRDWGQTKKYHHDMLAFNYRMDGIQGAVLGVKLKYLEDWTELRRSHALQYNTALDKAGISRSLEVSGRRHVYHVYSLFHPERQQLQKTLQNEEIHSGMHYPIPVHLQKPYQGLGYSVGSLPVSEKFAREQLSLPMFPELTEEQIGKVSDVVCGWAG